MKGPRDTDWLPSSVYRFLLTPGSTTRTNQSLNPLLELHLSFKWQKTLWVKKKRNKNFYLSRSPFTLFLSHIQENFKMHVGFAFFFLT